MPHRVVPIINAVNVYYRYMFCSNIENFYKHFYILEELFC